MNGKSLCAKVRQERACGFGPTRPGRDARNEAPNRGGDGLPTYHPYRSQRSNFAFVATAQVAKRPSAIAVRIASISS